jgi:hypothetical protein
MDTMHALTTFNATASFDCDRTCPRHRTHWCRFNALFCLIGSVRVHSHTAKIRVDYTDPGLLEVACKSLGWKWLGLQTHDLFDGVYRGHGFLPEGWAYPVVFSNGELHADTFNGSWGDEKQLDKLKCEYAIATAQQAAESLGWQCERTEAGLTVYHPEAGVLTVSKHGVCEATGFIGSSCHAAREALHLAVDGQVQNTPEFGQVAAQVQAGS